MLTGYEFFKLYHAFNLHFTTTRYDIFRYNGKTNVSLETFKGRRDYSRFVYWGNRFHNRVKAGQFILANFVYNQASSSWIYQPFEQANTFFTQWLRVKESLTKIFEDDMIKIGKVKSDHNLTFEQLFHHTPSGRSPPIWQMSNVGLITPESLILIDKEVMRFIDDELTSNSVDPFLEDTIFRLKKYSPFVKYDKEKINHIVKKVIRNGHEEPAVLE